MQEVCERGFERLAPKKSKVLAISAGAHVAVLGGFVAEEVIRSRKENAAAEKEAKKKAEGSKSELEKYFEEALPEEIAVPPLDKKEIIRRAQENLAAFREGKPYPHPFGEIFIHADVQDWKTNDSRLLKNSLRSYAADQAYLKGVLAEPGDSTAKLENAVRYLHQKYFYNYCRDVGYMAAFFSSEHCGNCQSNSKLVLANLIDAGFQPPTGFKLALQNYRDHLAPVLYDLKKEKVLDLVANQEQDSPQAPIYEPALLLRGLLDFYKEKSGPSTRDLLVKWVDKPGPGADAKVKSNTEFVGGSGSSAQGRAIPKFSRMSRGELGKFAGGGGDGTADSGWTSNNRNYANLKVNVVANGSDDEIWVKNIYGVEVGGSYEQPVVYVTKEAFDSCRAVLRQKTEAGVRECFDRRFKDFSQEKLRPNPLWQELKQIMANPFLAAKLKPERLKEISDFFFQTNQRLLGEFGQRAPDAEWEELLSAYESFDRRLSKDPMPFVDFLDSLPMESRGPLGIIFSPFAFQLPMSLFMNAKVNDRGQFPGLEKLNKVLTDDSIVAPYQQKTAIGPRDFVLYLDGNMQAGYSGQVRLPEGQSNELHREKKKELPPELAGSPSGREEGAAIHKKSARQLSAKTLAALVPMLNPDLKSARGLAKYFSSAVAREIFGDAPSFDYSKTALGSRYALLTDSLFGGRLFKNDPLAVKEFRDYLGGEKFVFFHQKTKLGDGMMMGSSRKSGPMPEYVAEKYWKSLDKWGGVSGTMTWDRWIEAYDPTKDEPTLPPPEKK